MVPLNSDNYGYLLIDEHSNNCALIDISGQPEIMLRVVGENNVLPLMILTTHKHWDHAGGNLKMLDAIPTIKIYGSVLDNVEGCTNFIEDNECLKLGDKISIRCILTPGHTMGHMSYYCTDGIDKVVFTGDCLFMGGAGKFFEGTGQEMYESLYVRLGSLPPDTKVYCGHEYTLSNYKFALSCEPENTHLLEANEIAKEQRSKNLPTLPSTIEKEVQTNPFMRVVFPTIKALFPGADTPSEILQAVREAKNKF